MDKELVKELFKERLEDYKYLEGDNTFEEFLEDINYDKTLYKKVYEDVLKEIDRLYLRKLEINFFEIFEEYIQIDASERYINDVSINLYNFDEDSLDDFYEDAKFDAIRNVTDIILEIN